jgi:hypothetical protein
MYSFNTLDLFFFLYLSVYPDSGINYYITRKVTLILGLITVDVLGILCSQ